MRSAFTHFVAFSVGLAAGAVSVAFLVSEREHTASITVVNASGGPIASVRLRNEETGSVLALDELPDGASETLRFLVRDEGTYTLTARLADGRSVEASRALGPGSAATERILADRVEPGAGPD